MDCLKDGFHARYLVDDLVLLYVTTCYYNALSFFLKFALLVCNRISVGARVICGMHGSQTRRLFQVRVHVVLILKALLNTWLVQS